MRGSKWRGLPSLPSPFPEDATTSSGRVEEGQSPHPDVAITCPSGSWTSRRKRGNGDVMRRAFVRLLGITPRRYRELAEPSNGTLMKLQQSPGRSSTEALELFLRQLSEEPFGVLSDGLLKGRLGGLIIVQFQQHARLGVKHR